MPGGTGHEGYSIDAASRLIGASRHTLRVWERRYGYPCPTRSDLGLRRYSPEQVEALRRVVERAGRGETIGMLLAELRAGQPNLWPADPKC